MGCKLFEMIVREVSEVRDPNDLQFHEENSTTARDIVIYVNNYIIDHTSLFHMAR